MDRRFTMTLDVDMRGEIDSAGQERILSDIPGLHIEIIEAKQGHGFGLAEVISVSVAIGAGVTSDLAASAIRSGIKAIIRRVRSSQGETNGTEQAIAGLIDRERNSRAREPESSEEPEIP
ncbi:hypothetical protein ACM614_07345 [Streptomyces sp. 12297]